MEYEPLNEFERQLAAICPAGSPGELRSAVLSGVERELRAARWDRRLARTAMMLLIVGIGLNASLAWRGARPDGGRANQVAADRSQKSLVETAVVVAEATDAETGRQVARQLAAWSGRELSGDELAAIDAAVRSRSGHIDSNGNKG